MPSRKYSTIGVEQAQLTRLRLAKAVRERQLGRRVDWTAFLMTLLDGIEGREDPGSPAMAEMRGSGPTDAVEETEAEFASIAEIRISLNEEDQQKLAHLVATKVVEYLESKLPPETPGGISNGSE